MLIDEAWTLWLGLLSIFSLHVLPRTIMLPSSTSTKLSILLASNALWFGCSTLVSSFKDGSWCRLFSVALNHKSVLVPPSPNPGLAPVLLKTVPSLSPLLFNLLVNGLAAAVQRSAPGAQFFPGEVRLLVNSMLTVWSFPHTLC